MYGRKEPPLVKGGQGKTDADIQDQGNTLLYACCWFAGLVAAIIGGMRFISWAVN